MLISLILAAGAAALQAPGPAVAAEPQPRRFEEAFLSPMGEPFYGRRAGEDGLIPWFQQADRNHDGALTQDEMAADAQRFFEVLDSNHDGEIDPDEIAHYEEVIAPQVRAQSIITTTNLPGGEQDVHVDNESRAGRFGLLAIPEPVVSADSNFNRGVSAEEFAKAAAERFRRLDVNRTGRLTLAELQVIRRAAATQSRRTPRDEAGPSDDQSSAEYGQPPM